MMGTAVLLSPTDVAAACNTAPAPVVFIDTCALLDLIRYVSRETTAQAVAKGYQPATAHGVETALRLLQKSRLGSSPIHLVVHELVPTEWNKHLEETKKAADAEIRKSNDLVTRLNAIGKINPAYQPSAFNLSDGLAVIDLLEQVGKQLLDASKLVSNDAACGYNAYLRCLRMDAPAAPGKSELKDCTIIEHYLAVCAALTANCSPRFFVSTNKNDYGENGGSKLREPLLAEFAAVNLKWVQNFSPLHNLL